MSYLLFMIYDILFVIPYSFSFFPLLFSSRSVPPCQTINTYPFKDLVVILMNCHSETSSPDIHAFPRDHLKGNQNHTYSPHNSHNPYCHDENMITNEHTILVPIDYALYFPEGARNSYSSFADSNELITTRFQVKHNPSSSNSKVEVVVVVVIVAVIILY